MSHSIDNPFTLIRPVFDTGTGSNTGRIRVNELSMDVMRHSLIRHFNIAFLRNEVKWTTRNTK